MDMSTFLVALFDEGLAVSSIKGYRSTINSVLRIAGRQEVVDNIRLSCLVQNLGLERPVTRSFFPRWDLALVLRALLGAPYEPMGTATLSVITQKTIFLVALASGRRRSEFRRFRLRHPFCGLRLMVRRCRCCCGCYFWPRLGSQKFCQSQS